MHGGDSWTWFFAKGLAIILISINAILCAHARVGRFRHHPGGRFVGDQRIVLSWSFKAGKIISTAQAAAPAFERAKKVPSHIVLLWDS